MEKKIVNHNKRHERRNLKLLIPAEGASFSFNCLGILQLWSADTSELFDA